MEKKAREKFVIIDGNAIVHRAWHALPPLQTKDGEMVNAIYGFMLLFFKIMKDLAPEYIAATFDLKGPTFRHKAFAHYKATRVKKPDELYAQIPKIKEILTAFGVPIYEKEGFEADDVIGTITKRVKDLEFRIQDIGIETVIVTGDLDTLQLVDEGTKVLTLKKGISDTVLYDAAAVKERYGLAPEQMIDYKALRGDPSDNIPGVAGIGEKTATELLQKFGSLETILEEVARCKKGGQCSITGKVLSKLENAEQTLEQSKMLVTIVRDVPITFSVEDAQWGSIDRDAVTALFERYEFHSLLKRIPNPPDRDPSTPRGSAQDDEKEPASKNTRYHLIQTEEQFKTFLIELKKQTAVVVHAETSARDPFRTTVIGVSFCWKDGEAFYLDCKEHPEWLKRLAPLLADHDIAKYGHNAKNDVNAFLQHGIKLEPVTVDTMIASYLLNPGSRQHGLEQVVLSALRKELAPVSERTGSGAKQLSMDAVTPERVADYACAQADATLQLVGALSTELEKANLLSLFEKIEMPLLPVLARMESYGVKIDQEYLADLSKDVKTMLRSLEKKVTKLAGTTFNLNSPAQLKEILFETLQISTKGIGKTKTGLSTAADELEKIKDAHPIIPCILEYRELAKLKSTYLDALPALVNPKSGRLHTSFNQTIAATGRLSSSNPNLQNIPVRTELGNEVRNAFVAEKGMTLLSLDYSQIELRVIASMANDTKMIAAFTSGEDVHARTAADVYGVPIEKVNPEQRRNAKTINFGIIYGLGAGGLAEQTGTSREEARAFIEQYFNVYSGIATYIEETRALARELGYAESLFGRRRYLPEMSSTMPQFRAQAERMAVNMPIQGTAADLMKLAMIEADRELPKLCEQAKMLLQVHDSLLVELPTKDLKTVARRLSDIMTGIYKLRVPIEVHIESGERWGSLKVLAL